MNSDQNKTVYPLDIGNRFSGELYFENISKQELNHLVCMLNCGEENETDIENRTHGYKLGSGKPAGLGSVTVKVNGIFVRNYCIEDGDYSVEPFEYERPDLKYADDFMKMTFFSGSDYVDYPRNKSDGNIFDWFSDNHKGANRNKKTDFIEPNRNGKKIIGMPNSRRGEIYLQYMEAMNPHLESLESLIDSNYSINNKHTDSRVCPYCKERPLQINDSTGKFYALCGKCHNEAPTCPVCKKNKCSFNKRSNKFYSICYECLNKGFKKR